jgi:hypothetical protein
MLRTGQLPAPLRGGLPPPRRRDLAQRRECCYRGPWRLPGPDSHRLAAVSLALGYTLLPPFVTPAPELLDAHSARNRGEERWPAALSVGAIGTPRATRRRQAACSANHLGRPLSWRRSPGPCRGPRPTPRPHPGGRDIDRVPVDRDRLDLSVALRTDADDHHVLGRGIGTVVAGHPEVAGADHQIAGMVEPNRDRRPNHPVGRRVDPRHRVVVPVAHPGRTRAVDHRCGSDGTGPTPSPIWGRRSGCTATPSPRPRRRPRPRQGPDGRTATASSRPARPASGSRSPAAVSRPGHFGSGPGSTAPGRSPAGSAARTSNPRTPPPRPRSIATRGIHSQSN